MKKPRTIWVVFTGNAILYVTHYRKLAVQASKEHTVHWKDLDIVKFTETTRWKK